MHTLSARSHLSHTPCVRMPPAMLSFRVHIDFAAPKHIAPFPFRQNHGICARYNQPGTFQVKNAAKTEARTMHQKARTIEIKQMSETSKTKPKNETKTEQNITVAGKMPTAGQRAVHFRALVIIGVAAACGLSVCAHAPLWSPLHAHCACTPTRLAVPRRTHLHASAFHTLGYACAH